MEARGGVFPDGMSVPDNGSAAEHASFFSNPHHSFLYGDGALKYSMSPAYPNEFAFAPQADASTLHQQLQFSGQPLPHHSQPPFVDPYAAQHLQQHVRPSPSTISPSQLQPQPQQAQAYHHQPPLTWDELNTFPNNNNDQNITRQQTTASPDNPSAAAPIHRTTLIAPNTTHQWGLSSPAVPHTSNSPGNSTQLGNGDPAEPATYLAGCYWCTVEPETNVPDQWTGKYHLCASLPNHGWLISMCRESTKLLENEDRRSR